MKNIELLKTIELGRVPEGEKNKELTEIFNGESKKKWVFRAFDTAGEFNLSLKITGSLREM